STIQDVGTPRTQWLVRGRHPWCPQPPPPQFAEEVRLTRLLALITNTWRRRAWKSPTQGAITSERLKGTAGSRFVDRTISNFRGARPIKRESVLKRRGGERARARYPC